MARPLRIEFPGGLYHVTSRGDGREDIYFDNEDRDAWLKVLAQVCERHNWRCHAWCQMSNHYHIVVETVEGNLSTGMRQLNGVYTQFINRRYGRVGHVFQGRYKAILVEKESHLLELARYVVLNPLRAGMVKRVRDWPWSSYAAMVGTEAAPDWLEVNWLLAQFSRRRSTAIEKYIDFVRAGVGLPSIWEQLRGQIFLGSEGYADRMRSRIDAADLQEVPLAQRRPPAQPIAHFRDSMPDRNAAICAAYATGAYSMQQIADAFGVHYATISRVVKAGEG